MRGTTIVLILFTIAASTEACASELPTVSDFCFQGRHLVISPTHLEDTAPGISETERRGKAMMNAGAAFICLGLAVTTVMAVLLRNPANRNDIETAAALRTGLILGVTGMVGGGILLGGGEQLSKRE